VLWRYLRQRWQCIIIIYNDYRIMRIIVWLQYEHYRMDNPSLSKTIKIALNYMLFYYTKQYKHISSIIQILREWSSVYNRSFLKIILCVYRLKNMHNGNMEFIRFIGLFYIFIVWYRPIFKLFNNYFSF